MKTYPRLVFVSAVLFLAAMDAAVAIGPSSRAAAAGPEAAAPVQGGIDLAGMDRSIAPGDDFFAHANGGWMKSTEIPKDRSSWGTGGVLEELTARRIADLIAETAKAKGAPGSDARKIGDYYASFMDEPGIEALGLAPLKTTLDAIGAISDPQGLARTLGSRLRADVDVLNNTNFHTDNLFGLWVAQDLDDPSRYTPFLLQGGLGMPDRDYYLDPSPRMAQIRTRYEAHLAAVLRLAGLAESEGKAARILALERRIALAHASRLDSEDVRKGDNHWTREELSSRAPGLDWPAFLSAAGLSDQKDFVVWQPAALIGISAVVGAEPLATWKEYLILRALERASPFLAKAFVDERFEFYGKVLRGTPALAERWKRGVQATDDALGELVGKLYVARYFPASEKARAEAMVRNEVVAFGHRIDSLTWMAPATKARAKAKLAALKVGVGYPDKWRDYAALEIVPGDALGNAQRASSFEYRRNLEKLGHPVDRGEWVMNAQLVNAVNLPAMNALNFPAAILQPPYFDPSRPAAVDYGATGATIGHEISHSFDDQGALFDANGRLSNWWTKEDFAHFEESSAALVRQYDGYHPFPDLAVNGKLTVSENIADVAGLAVAYDAYRLSLGGKEGPSAQGLTGDQQFFLSFAQSWRDKTREAARRQRILTDSHAPDDYRADTVRNLDAWYAAFAVKPGQALFLAPKDRVRVW
jgi:predicted metalloendopeptidase